MELGTKDFVRDLFAKFSESPIQEPVFYFLFAGLNLFMAKNLLANSLTTVRFNSVEIHFKNIFLSKSVVWKDIQKVTFQDYRETKAGLTLWLPGEKKLKFHALFGIIGPLVYKKLKEFRPDLVGGSKTEAEFLDWYPRKSYPKDES